MSLIDKLATIFFDLFGITRPTEDRRHLAAWFVFGLMLAMASLIVLGGVLLYRVLRA